LFGTRVFVGISGDNPPRVLGETPTFTQSPQNPTHNPLDRGRVLGIEKNTLKFGEKWGLNSLNTLVPNIFLKVSGDLRFGGNYPH
jgi:hypothetical protein